ncbi:carbon-nitrogen hydrolase family protein [Novosphingobium sp.]|uniref:carbon-nitrogen hydrolase family protein n=1 Tax=Novosphingobium sp. TaxID=1874826 RepID=UPI0025D7C87C|nr:carbon-nitrogen hydrolase family protein [Novosphingobium sp.]
MNGPTRIAVLQMTSGIDPEANYDTIRDAADEAAREGATMLFTPEMSLLLDRDRKRGAANIPPEGDNLFATMLGKLATERGLTICLGSMAVARSDGKLANRAMVFSPAGGAPVTYDKIHMFDVDLASGESWRESNAYAPGVAVVAVDDTPLGRLGLAICYDIRFPALFEALGQARCDAIAIPAAFTVPTGRAHWHLLQRARAVEASAWVIAAAQCGCHADGRETYGHSLVVDPWGEVVLDLGGEGAALGFATIDPARTAEVRAQLPNLYNKRAIPTSMSS